MNIIVFLCFWVTNSLFFYLASLFWSTAVVLGNNIRSPFIAAIMSGFILTLVITLVPFILKSAGYKIKKEKEQAAVYFIFNAIGIWLIAKLANFLGFGIKAFWVALILAAVVNLLQLLVWKYIVKQNK